MSESQYKKLIIGISFAVPVLVTVLFFLSVPELNFGIDLMFFPKFHAIINFTTTILLLLGLFFIKQNKIGFHKACMGTAIALSAIFLCSYVFYHTISEPTGFGGEGMVKPIYYFILITHIILAAIILPFILFTLLHALTGHFEKHKKLAKWTLPIWLYVTITGVLVYVFMAPYY